MAEVGDVLKGHLHKIHVGRVEHLLDAKPRYPWWLRLTLIERADKSAREIMGIEIAQVVKALADADLDDGQLKLVADGQARCLPWPCRRAS